MIQSFKLRKPEPFKSELRREMKSQSILYWIVTGVMAAFMLMASIPDVLMLSGAVDFIKHFGYAAYLLPFYRCCESSRRYRGAYSPVSAIDGMGVCGLDFRSLRSPLFTSRRR